MDFFYKGSYLRFNCGKKYNLVGWLSGGHSKDFFWIKDDKGEEILVDDFIIE